MNDIKTRDLQISIKIREMNIEILNSRLECKFQAEGSKDELTYCVILDKDKGLMFKKFYKTYASCASYAISAIHDTDYICELIFNQIGIYTNDMGKEKQQVMNEAKKLFKTATETAITNATEETAAMKVHQECINLPIISIRPAQINEINRFLKNSKKNEGNDDRGNGM